MDPWAVLAAYDEQIRRRPVPDPGGWIERADDLDADGLPPPPVPERGAATPGTPAPVRPLMIAVHRTLWSRVRRCRAARRDHRLPAARPKFAGDPPAGH